MGTQLAGILKAITMQNANDGRSNNETRKKCSDIDATLTIPITLGVTLEQASIKHAIGEYEHRSDSTHLPPRELGPAPDEVQYKHNRWCCLHRQGCGERNDGEFCSVTIPDSTNAVAAEANSSGTVLGVVSGRKIEVVQTMDSICGENKGLYLQYDNACRRNIISSALSVGIALQGQARLKHVTLYHGLERE